MKIKTTQQPGIGMAPWIILVLAGMVIMACGVVQNLSGTQNNSPAGQAAPTATLFVIPTLPAESPADTPLPAINNKPTPTSRPAPNQPVAKIPDDSLVQTGKLLICTDFPYPPQEFYDENGHPQGMDVEIGAEIANRLGLQTVFVNTPFDKIFPPDTSGICDISLSAINITSDRQKWFSMIPYFNVGQSFLVLQGNPHNINTTTDLCGQSVAALSGTTMSDYLQGIGYYQDNGLTQACTAAGKHPITTNLIQKDADALQLLQSDKVVAYFAASDVAAYYTVQYPDQFQLTGSLLNASPEGIGVPCGQIDCTNATLSPLGQAVQTALRSMMDDGTYMKILTKWNLTNGAVNSQ